MSSRNPILGRVVRRNVSRARLAIMLMCAQGAAGAAEAPAPPALTSFAQSVLQAHPLVQAAQADLAAARAHERGVGRALYNPELDAEHEAGEVRTSSIGINQTIDLGGKREARQHAAAFETQAASESLALVRQGVLAELLSALGMVDVALEQLRIADERKALMKRLRTLTNERRAAGDVAQIEIEVARLAHVEATLLRSRSAVRQITAEQALARVAGGDLPAYPSLPTVYARVSLNDSVATTILGELPSVRSAQAQVAAARAVVDLRRRERRPDPTVGLYAGREGDEDLVGIRFSIPLPVRNSFRAEVDEASAEFEALDRLVANDYRQLRAELMAAQQRYELERTAWAEWQRDGAGSLTRQTEMLERLWRAGELSTTEYLVQIQQTLNTRVEAAEQRGAVWEAWIAWLAVSGQVDAWVGISQ